MIWHIAAPALQWAGCIMAATFFVALATSAFAPLLFPSARSGRTPGDGPAPVPVVGETL